MDLRARARNEERSGERGGREELGPATEAACAAAAAAQGSSLGDLTGGGGGVGAVGGEAINGILLGLIPVCCCSSKKV